MTEPRKFDGVGGRLVVLAVTTFNRRDYLRECLESWAATRNPAYRWLVVVADDGSTDGTLNYLEKPDIPADCHLIRNVRRGAGGQTNTIFQLCRRLDYAIGFKIDDDLVFKRKGWDDLYINAVRRSGYEHLCHLNLRLFNAERRPPVPLSAGRPLALDPSGSCAAYTDVYNCMGCLFTFTPRLLAAVGNVDESNFPIRGDWHIDYSARAARAGFNRVDTFFDARDSGRYIDIQNNLKSVYQHTIAPHSAQMRAVSSPAEIERRRKVVRDETRVFVEMAKKAG
jgi:glycosyltransferase involved in cell wall biosynthesis